MYMYITLLMITTQALGLVESVNLRPIIGILAQETSNGASGLNSHGDTYIPANYVKWLESAGSRVVPIRIKEPMQYYQQIFSRINGVLFPGGGVDILTSEFAKAAKVLYKLTLNANDRGDYFPLWGTCQGFEVLTALTSGQNLLANADAENLLLPLNFAKDFQHSRLYRHLPRDVMEILSTKNVTPNFHKFTLTPKNYSENEDLKQFYRVLSTNKDRNGLEFISTLEAYRYPIYAIQWHPEKNNFAWNPLYNLDHNTDGIHISQYFADFFVNEARKSAHHFPDVSTEIKSLINNFHPVFSQNDKFVDDYYFNYTRHH